MKYKKLFLIFSLICLFFFVTIFSLYRFYLSPIENNSQKVTIKIDKNKTGKQIGKILSDNKIIRNDFVFTLYLKLHNIGDLKSGTYELDRNMNLKEIVSTLRDGSKINNETIKITFKEGINFRQLAKVIEEKTNNSYDSVLNVLNDKDYINSLIADYWFLENDILDENIYYPLEGYLFPDTYEFKNKDVTVHEIFKRLLDQMDLVLSSYKNRLSVSNFSIHELLTLASIAEKEVAKEVDRSKVISVFVNRLNKNMSLGSDITTRYAIKLDDTRALTKSEYGSESPYNTRNVKNTKLPPSPICTISKGSIEASLNYEDTNYLYFISNIATNETFFFETSRDFENKKQELATVNKGY